MEFHERIILNNKAWVQQKIEDQPDYFEKLAQLQQPNIFWIGCSDSRAPVNEITGTSPGEIFVHRNVANLVVHTDLNLLSALQYSVEMLGVEHIIVCGHYGCGGVKAAMGNAHLGIINKWLRNIKDVYRLHNEELHAIENENERFNRLVELNVKEQVSHVAETSIVQGSWARNKRPIVHGWVFNLNNGLLNKVYQLGPGDYIDPIYRYTQV